MNIETSHKEIFVAQQGIIIRLLILIGIILSISRLVISFVQPVLVAISESSDFLLRGSETISKLVACQDFIDPVK